MVIKASYCRKIIQTENYCQNHRLPLNNYQYVDDICVCVSRSIDTSSYTNTEQFRASSLGQIHFFLFQPKKSQPCINLTMYYHKVLCWFTVYCHMARLDVKKYMAVNFILQDMTSLWNEWFRTILLLLQHLLTYITDGASFTRGHILQGSHFFKWFTISTTTNLTIIKKVKCKCLNHVTNTAILNIFTFKYVPLNSLLESSQSLR